MGAKEAVCGSALTRQPARNTRRALHREWLLTNERGDCSGSSILCCNTRKYHGLLAVNTPYGRHVLLSALEESVCGGGREFFFLPASILARSIPTGTEYLEAFQLDQWPQSTYRVGEVSLSREVLLARDKSLLLLRYELRGPEDIPPLTLRIKPLLAYRNVHALTRVNPALRTDTLLVAGGFAARPYESLPPLYIQAAGDSGKACARAANAEGAATSEKCGPHAAASFFAEPDWCRNVEYFEERERGFDDSEDLFMPGTLEIALPPLPQGGLRVCGGWYEACGENLRTLWETESRARTDAHLAGGGLAGQLAQAGGQFCITTPSGRATVIAGYPWFDDWGRDTLISMPGLTFYAGREEFGLHVLAEVGRHIRNGLVPNMFSESGEHAYNSVDASLWYAFALQQVLAAVPDGLAWAAATCLGRPESHHQGLPQGAGHGHLCGCRGPAACGRCPHPAYLDGCPGKWLPGYAPARLPCGNQRPLVQHACLCRQPCRRISGAAAHGERQRAAMRDAFLRHFWTTEEGGYLGDVWRNGQLDRSVRPIRYLPCPCRMPCLRTIFSRRLWNACATGCSLPFGLRTLAPDAAAYKGRYEGNGESRVPPTIRALSGPGCWAIMLMHCCTRPGI